MSESSDDALWLHLASWITGMPAGDRHELILLFRLLSGFLIAADQFASSYTKITLTDFQRQNKQEENHWIVRAGKAIYHLQKFSWASSR